MNKRGQQCRGAVVSAYLLGYDSHWRKATDSVRISEIEFWTIRMVELIGNQAPLEDARVELKAQWPDPAKAARRIAGHANAARGENILWIIGLDETHGLVGAAPEDLANWYPQVQKYFDGVAPALTDVVVPVHGRVVVALLFDTDRAPFVVRGSSPDSLEVPWREGTRVVAHECLR